MGIYLCFSFEQSVFHDRTHIWHHFPVIFLGLSMQIYGTAQDLSQIEKAKRSVASHPVSIIHENSGLYHSQVNAVPSVAHDHGLSQ